jgi:small GTP-binding protein
VAGPGPSGGLGRITTKVCLVGDPSVGKSSLISRYVLDKFDDTYLTTIGTKISKKEATVRDPRSGRPLVVSMLVWDIMGQANFRDVLREAYFTGAHGILATADITRRETLEGLPAWIEAVRQTAGRVSTIIALNKADLLTVATYDRAEAARVTGVPESEVFLTSAKTGEHVPEAFQRLAEMVAELHIGVGKGGP